MSDMMVTHVTERDAPTEDPDAAPANEVAATDRQRPAACLLADEPAGLLWVADKEGWVYGEHQAGRLAAGWRPWGPGQAGRACGESSI